LLQLDFLLPSAQAGFQFIDRFAVGLTLRLGLRDHSELTLSLHVAEQVRVTTLSAAPQLAEVHA